jgi:S-adenosylmethionine:tRNA ribosyltransferase-isomerase
VDHASFADLPRLLAPGDVLVVNTSATLPAALPAQVAGEGRAELHLSTRLPGGLWVVEPRRPGPGPEAASRPWLDAAVGTVFELPGGGRARLAVPAAAELAGPVRLWVAGLELPEALLPYLARHGRPIRYGYVPRPWPLAAYQTVFARHPGSAEMPSAARPFTAELVARLVSRGVTFAPFTLHCGVASPEAHEPPSAEWYRVPDATVAAVRAARQAGRRVIAVGTTAVRALETVTGPTGQVYPGEGWTELVIGPNRPLRVVDGIITGWHEPGASHLALLEAVAGRDLIVASYEAARREGYLWHEFGDSHLVLP